MLVKSRLLFELDVCQLELDITVAVIGVQLRLISDIEVLMFEQFFF